MTMVNIMYRINEWLPVDWGNIHRSGSNLTKADSIQRSTIMADFKDRLEANAPGKYYVDSTCIDCDACRQIAPELFARDDETNYAYVSRQPQDATEEALAREAAESCCTESIGTDGHQMGTCHSA